MMRLLVLTVLAILPACSQEEPAKDAKPVVEAAAVDEASDELETEQKSIEQAADAAAKLVEQETIEELDALRSQQQDEP